MIPPIRCFTCGKVIADKYDYYVAEKQKLEKEMTEKQPSAGERHFESLHTGEIMTKLGLTRYCCRRMMLGVEDMMDKI